MEIESASKTYVGRRTNNEDDVVVEPGLGVFAVADGMGGYEGGEVASRIVVESIRELFERDARDADATWPCGFDPGLGPLENLLSASLCLANRAVCAKKTGRLAAMGATVAAVAVRGSRVVVGHVGDSRVYRLRDGRVEQLTEDHSPEAELRALGFEPAAVAQMAHVVTRAIGIPDKASPDLRTEEARVGDVLLICSDGLSDVLEPDDIAPILRSLPPGGACEALVDLAFERGSHDNITVVVVRIVTGDQSSSSP
jgi:serine/threonine protein phosphatase PrpC